MPLVKRRACLLVSLGWVQLAFAQSPEVVSEKDFLEDMPIVLSVSRLPQRLDETPGAVTILDRNMIRLSGARDVADLLRLVPGFQTSMSFENVAPLASYHGGFDGYSNRVQVLVDGRSAFSPYFIGSIGPGLQTVALVDIERIEVLRGSNSAAYGARAFLGVINIVTRDTLDTIGLQASLTGGEIGIRDAQARIGWGQQDARFRLTADRRADDGLAGANGHNQINRVNLRADLRADARTELQLRAGGYSINSGKGQSGRVDDPLRDASFDSSYLQADWRRTLGADSDVAVSVSHTQEVYRDTFPYALVPVDIDGSGTSSSDNISVQHTLRSGPALRVVWGGEFRREKVTSKPLYNTDAALVTDFTRLFGNAEWRLSPNLLLNAGAMAENSSVTGDSISPRLMLNWHVADGQTWRAGVSKAYRPPSSYEKSSDVRYFLNGKEIANTTRASGNVVPENVLVRELGYLGDFPRWGLNLDVRLFHEQINGFVRQINANPSAPKDYANTEDFPIHGLEYQLKFRPWRDSQFIVNQSFTEIDASVANGVATPYAAPKLTSTITFFQKLPGGIDLSLMHQDSGTRTLQGSGLSSRVATTRTDVRLAMPLRVGSSRGEVALVVQNLGAPYDDFASNFQFQRRAFVTLRVEN